jgi:hypothetical protein
VITTEEAIQAWEELLPILSQDAEEAIKFAEKEKTSRAYRSAFRTLFASLEGFIYLMKLLPQAGSRSTPGVFSVAELALLEEETYGLDESGEPRTWTKYLRLEDNLRFTIRMLAKRTGSEFELDLNDGGWQSLKASLQIRHRVTHPRHKSDLAVTEEEFKRLVKGFNWAHAVLVRNLARSFLTLYDEVEDIKARVKRLRATAGGGEQEDGA